MLSDILHIIKNVQAKITYDSDVAGTRYGSPATLLAELTSYIQQLEAGQVDCLKQLDLHFAPTSTFQEHAISNGWGQEYLALAEEFDKLYTANKAAANH